MVVFGLITSTSRALNGASRAQFGRSIEALMCFYEDQATLTIDSQAAPVSIQFQRSSTDGDGCELIITLSDRTRAPESQAAISDQLLRRAFEPIAMPDASDHKCGSCFTTRIKVLNIWSVGAGNRAAGIACDALDLLGIEREKKFALKYSGKRSLSRTREARERIDPESLYE